MDRAYLQQEATMLELIELGVRFIKR